MYTIGDKVLHQTEGACYITGIVDREIDCKTKQYYALESVINRNDKVYVSTEKHDRLRAVVDKAVLRQSETEFQQPQASWPESPKERYQELIRKIEALNFSEAMGVFRGLTLENKKSKLALKDEHLRKLSEKLVCSEIAIILNKSYDYVTKEVTKYILGTNVQAS